MQSKFPRKSSLLCAAISLALLPVAGTTFAQQDTVEEVVVTGSFIRRTEGFRAASPITQISADDIALAGTPNMGDIIHNLSFNQGTSVTANGLVGASNVSTSLNLRGLGAGATLDLTDGLRTLGGNINSALPYIAIQRMDIVTDGAAALYGSAAVAGVVNYIPYKSYDGFKLEHMTTMDDRGDYNDVQFGMLWGTEFNGIDLVVAADWRENSRLEMRDRPYVANSAFTWSSTTAIGDYSVPTRDASGNITGSATQMDPACGAESGPPTEIGNGEFGFVQNNVYTRRRDRCAYEYGEFWDYRTPLQRGNLFASASYDFSEDLKINTTYQYGRLITDGRGSPFNPGSDLTVLPAVRGDIPGNPFPAVDANGNQLYALDVNGDGVPDRMDGSDPWSQVILSDALNGIPFNEDVTFSSWRPWAKHGTKPTVFNSDGSSPQGHGQSWSHRYTLQADFTVPKLEGWEGRAAYMFAKAVNNGKEYNGSVSGFVQGLSCDVANDRDACFTPFGTGPEDYNTQAVADSTINYARGYDTDQMHTLDVIVNGDLFPSLLELPGGSVGAAFGYQRRDNSYNDRPPAFRIANDQFLGSQQFVEHGGRTVDSIFMELAIPILDNLEFSAAVREEDYSTGQNSTDPKYGIVYSPLQSLTLRASMGTSFIAPSLGQLTAPEGCGLNSVQDKFGPFNAYTATCSQGNPDLTPESADTLSYGFDWDIIDGMRLSVTYSETDFTDRITTAGAQSIVNLDYLKWRTANNKPAGAQPTESELLAWSNGPGNHAIIRSPLDVYEITRVNTGSINASQMLVEAYDMDWRYSFVLPELFNLNDLGAWTVSLQATYLDKFLYQETALNDLEQAVGKRNNASLSAVPPMPRIKANARIGWVRGSHSANLSARYIHDIAYDGYSGFYTNPAIWNLHSDVYSRNPTQLRKYTVADFAYNFRGYEALGGELNFSVGSRNVFDRMPQRMPSLGGTEDSLYDTMGRTIYARITYEL
jgi:iron complex outermembrane recepter protein